MTQIIRTKVTKYSGGDPRDIKGARITFTGVPFIILGRKVCDCKHGIDSKAGEKRKRKEAKEVKKKRCVFIYILVVKIFATMVSQ